MLNYMKNPRIFRSLWVLVLVLPTFSSIQTVEVGELKQIVVLELLGLKSEVISRSSFSSVDNAVGLLVDPIDFRAAAIVSGTKRFWSL